MIRTTPSRPRVNQPTGFRGTGSRGPSYYYGRTHEYVFFPIGWTDEMTGRSYERGYYDENGQHYDTVVFENNGRYENVVCHCPYCDQETIMNPSASEISARKLQCPNCGGSMEIRSALDAYQTVPQGFETASRGFGSAAARSGGRKNLLLRVIVILVVFFTAMTAFGSYLLKKEGSQPQEFRITEPDPAAAQDEESFGDLINLAEADDNAYIITDEISEKQLVWDADMESYYDLDTDCWLWYNTDVEPPLWQYWYEGISSDFGDYGWMEHDDDGWFIEESAGNWIALPEEYDTGDLWYIEE